MTSPIIETMARAIAESYGQDPDEFAPLGTMCTADNSSVQWWCVYEEQARAALASIDLSGLREEVAKKIALAGLGTTDGRATREPPNDGWTQEAWEARILECIPGAVEQRCRTLADQILALLSNFSPTPTSAPLSAGGWQPIETAPEGVEVLCSSLAYGHGPARFAFVGILGDGVWSARGLDDEWWDPYPPAHWRPLPAPPGDGEAAVPRPAPAADDAPGMNT